MNAPTPPVALPEALREAVRDAIAEAIGQSAYDCIRVWSAWSVGTMSSNDFVPIVDQGDRLEEITDAVLTALAQHTAQRAGDVASARTILKDLEIFDSLDIRDREVEMGATYGHYYDVDEVQKCVANQLAAREQDANRVEELEALARAFVGSFRIAMVQPRDGSVALIPDENQQLGTIAGTLERLRAALATAERGDGT